jgi:hypothetical protein
VASMKISEDTGISKKKVRPQHAPASPFSSESSSEIDREKNISQSLLITYLAIKSTFNAFIPLQDHC